MASGAEEDVRQSPPGVSGDAPKIPAAARTNIESVAQIEHGFVRQRSSADRVGQAITRIAGSLGFVGVHLAGLATWVVLNTGLVPGAVPFDPFPFSLLGVLVSLEAMLLTSFVLMTQRRQSRQAEHWQHLNLQIALLAEQEATKTLQMNRAICERLGVATGHDAELQEMIEKTTVSHLAEELAQNLDKTRAAAESGELPARD
jgi:uncharacterized membrane protein